MKEGGIYLRVDRKQAGRKGLFSGPFKGSLQRCDLSLHKAKPSRIPMKYFFQIGFVT